MKRLALGTYGTSFLALSAWSSSKRTRVKWLYTIWYPFSNILYISTYFSFVHPSYLCRGKLWMYIFFFIFQYVVYRRCWRNCEDKMFIKYTWCNSLHCHLNLSLNSKVIRCTILQNVAISQTYRTPMLIHGRKKTHRNVKLKVMQEGM